MVSLRNYTAEAIRTTVVAITLLIRMTVMPMDSQCYRHIQCYCLHYLTLTSMT